ncbi:MAG: beta strand repeat-containing protein [Acidobacteriota bacterium]
MRCRGIWIQQAYLKASNTGVGDFFGYSVAVSGDTVLVGTPYEDSSATGVNGNQNDNSATSAGAAYVFNSQSVNIAINTGNNQISTVGASVPINPGIVVQDQSNNPVSGVQVNYTIGSGGGIVTGGSQVTDSNGVATVGSWTLGNTVGSNTLIASVPGFIGSPLTFTATGIAGAATQIAIQSGNILTATVGTAVSINPSIIVRDAFNNPVSGTSVNFTVASGGGSITGSTQTTDANGIATVESWTLGNIAGTNTLTASAAGLIGSPVTFTVTGAPGAATQIAVNAGNNQLMSIGTTVSIPPSVTVRDVYNNSVSGIPVTFAVSSGGGQITGGSQITNTSGIATVGSWTLGSSAGINTLSATSSGLSGSPVTITATGTAQLVIATQPVGGSSGSALTTQPVVEIRDSAGNVVITSTAAVTASIISGSNGTLTGTTTVNAVNGVATFTNLSLAGNAGATYVLNFSSPGMASVTSNNLLLTAGAASQISVNGGNNQTATVGTMVPTAPSVIIRDAQNNPVAGASVTFVVASGGGSIAGGSQITNASGIATVGSWILGNQSGINTLTASSTSLASSTIVITATGTAGPPLQLSLFTGNNQTGNVGSSALTLPSVIVRDSYNNPVPGIPVTFAVSSGGGNITGESQTTNANGIASVGSWTLGSSAGLNTLTATSAGLTGSPITFTATGIAQLGIATQPVGGSSGSALSIQPVVEIRDSTGNVATTSSAAVTVSILSGSNGALTGTTTVNAVNGIATFTDLSLAGNAGTNYVLIFSSPGMAAVTSNNVTVTGVSTNKLAIIRQPVAGMSGKVFASQPIVAIQDAMNNTVTTSSAAVSVTIASGAGGTLGGTTTINAVNGVVTFTDLTMSGNVGTIYTLRFTSPGAAQADSTNVTIMPVISSVPTVSSQGGPTISQGNTVSIAQTLTNTSAIPVSPTYVAALPAGLSAISCTVPFGACTISTGARINTDDGLTSINQKSTLSTTSSNRTISWTGTIPGNGSVTITYLVQVSVQASSGTQYCVTSTINGVTGSSACLKVSTPSSGPGKLPLAAVLPNQQKPGSILIFNLYTSSASTALSDSQISLTNTNPVSPINVHLFFVDGTSCTVADQIVTLTQNQTASFMARDVDPGVTGFIIAVAVDSSGCPIVADSGEDERRFRAS